MKQDDDIKIFTPTASLPEPDDLDELAVLAQLHRANGNLDRAKALGERLAQISVNTPELRDMTEEARFDLTPSHEQQLRVLMVFSAHTALEAILTPSLLADAARTAMNESFIVHAGTFWNSVSDGRVFTQYLLAIRMPLDLPAQARRVGETFAGICGQEDNPELIALGANVFQKTHTFISETWRPASA
ncbi:MAG: hypothetical protein LBB67_04175 [Oscillospiraceae bacterium]|jgi:hypothetical protein|nr:hypothetical protein [Oscillospiraceae bacterium]